MGTRGVVATVGYGTRHPEALIAQLAAEGVACVVDVRALADSTTEGFSGEELAASLADHDLSYVHLAALGDFQPVTYEEYMESPEWSREYRRLVGLAEELSVALLCRCPEVERCHRRAIADRLAADGFRIVHLSSTLARAAVTLD